MDNKEISVLFASVGKLENSLKKTCRISQGKEC